MIIVSTHIERVILDTSNTTVSNLYNYYCYVFWVTLSICVHTRQFGNDKKHSHLLYYDKYILTNTNNVCVTPRR